MGFWARVGVELKKVRRTQAITPHSTGAWAAWAAGVAAGEVTGARTASSTLVSVPTTAGVADSSAAVVVASAPEGATTDAPPALDSVCNGDGDAGASMFDDVEIVVAETVGTGGAVVAAVV